MVDSNREMELTLDDTLSPPSAEMVVIKHELLTGIYEKPLFCIRLSVEEDAVYRASAWIYISNSYEGSDISLIFHGNSYIDLKQADLELRNQWQEIFVTTRTLQGQFELAPSLSVAFAKTGVLFSSGWKVSKESEATPLLSSKHFKSKARRTYKVLPLDQFLNQNPDIVVQKCLDGLTLPIAPISFGDKENPGFECLEYPEPGHWGGGVIDVPEIKNVILRNALVHGESGIVTIGDQLILETIKLPSYDDFEIKWEGENLLSLPDETETISVGHGAHLFCGYPGTRNYSHFLIDILSAALIPPFSQINASATLLCSHLYQAYQNEYLHYFPEFLDRALFVKGLTKIRCDHLSLSTFSVINSHYTPHPYHRTVLRGLANRISEKSTDTETKYPKKIYIDRRDSTIRSLLNEDEVINCVEQYGFTRVSLTGLSIEKQILFFSSATHIIAPHGAGSTNILFCNENTKYLELLMDKYVQWSMRRINSLVPIQYGCLIGCEIQEDPSSHNQKWIMSIERLKQAISEMLT